MRLVQLDTLTPDDAFIVPDIADLNRAQSTRIPESPVYTVRETVISGDVCCDLYARTDCGALVKFGVAYFRPDTTVLV